MQYVLVMLAVLCLWGANTAEAKRANYGANGMGHIGPADGHRVGGDRDRVRSIRAHHGRTYPGKRRGRMAISAGTYLPHPAGCPRIAFCGCGASIEVFGHSIRSLWVAANWLRFPRVAAAPGMAAARSGHVMVIRQVMANGMALVYDANSGGHRTRLHVRSLAGYKIVNPRG